MNYLRLPLFIVILMTGLLVGCGTGSNLLRQEPAHQNTPQHPVTAIATRMLGKPYRFGGASPSGFDCSGLVYYAYSKAGYTVPRTSMRQYHQSTTIAAADIREGDLLFFRIEGKVSHVGVYLGSNRFIHAPSSGNRVSIASLNNPYWRQRLSKTGRF